ncbi:MAG: error-prone DNA polymerase [Planctomycetes bacterium]|nr:error-prone DNA polymerase [Planctomycetota bacterium]
MPEQPPSKRQPTCSPSPFVLGDSQQHRNRPSHNISGDREPLAKCGDADSPLAYAELHCRSNFSFLEGASHPDELVARAAALGLSALAITDRNSLAGVVRAHVAAKESKLKLLIGAEIAPLDAPPIVLWSMHRAGYANLCQLITRGRRNAPKGECRLMFADIAEHAAGLLAGVVLSRGMRVESLKVHCGSPSTLNSQLSTLSAAFGDRTYAITELHRGPEDRQRLQGAMRLARDAGLPLIAANDVYCHVRERQPLQEVLTAIQHGCTVAELGERRFPNAERHLKSAAEMATLFAECPDAVARTIDVAARCQFSLDELRYEYPEELCPRGLTPIQHLINLTWRGAKDRYPRGVPDKVQRLIEHELKLIDELKYAAYFLTVWDLVRFARERDILCQGRGSAANSAVCFCLGVTSVDPDRIDVLFERFISRERGEAPDIDVDFEHERREEVIQYLYEKYGRERAGMTAEVISYRPRSAVRDVGKALGLSLDRVDVLAKQVDHLHDRDKLEARFREVGFPLESRLGQQLIKLVEEVLDFPRHLSQHVGGMVLTNGLLCELVPIENAAMPGRTVIEWDKDDLDALGILKVDVLALGMLTAIRKCFELVHRHHGRELSLANIPAYDHRVFEMIGRSDTMGVFQIESRAQMSMLPRLKPRCFYDLVIEVAIVRPGPIQGDMVHPYLRRRSGEEKVEYPDDRIRAVLEKTLGVPIFQEQAMRLVVVAAGFTPGEADQLRRAMSVWRRRGVIDQFQKKLIDGMTANGYSAEFADRVFRQLRGFGEYGFPESHACSFALLVWASAWLKFHYPAAFAAALLNSQPMGFYAPAQLVADARQHGVAVLPVDVNNSEWDCVLEKRQGEGMTRRRGDKEIDRSKESFPSSSSSSLLISPSPCLPLSPCLRLGFRMLAGFSAADAAQIVLQRDSRPFTSLDEFAERTGLSNSVLTRLSRADAFASLQLGRRSALWQSLPDHSPSLLLETEPVGSEPTVSLPKLGAFGEVVADYRTIGLSLRGHPLKFLRPQLDARRITPSNRLPSTKDGRFLRVAGLVLMRQRPSTAKGITFVTLEDETGIVNLIVRPEVWERHHQAAHTATMLLAHGILQRHDSVIHVLVNRLEDLSRELAQIEIASRDFR